MDWLKLIAEIDTRLLLWLNSHHSGFFDSLMILVTERFTWIPLYAIIIGVIVFKHRSNWIMILTTVILLVIFTDLFSSSVLKPMIQRLRPCHDPTLLDNLHLPLGCGGLYGFVSSHAANTFALATIIWLMFKNNKWGILLFFWAGLVSYSRIYLGAHFPGDVIAGMFLGMFSAIGFYKVFQVFEYRKIKAG